jgi:hypothetical protein
VGTYKVLQDIEAEDKLLGPLTLKQFIFAAIAVVSAYLCFLALTHGVGILTIFLVPPMAVFGILAWPWSRDQSTEVWLLAKLRFMIKPRKRVWDQDGMRNVVTVTAPTTETQASGPQLSQGEVKSRLQALANTIDSRGWAVKNVSVNLTAQPDYVLDNSSDRLINPNILPQQVATADVNPADDIMDEQNNPVAQNLDRLISASSANRRQQIIEQMRQSSTQTSQPPADYWFMNQPSGSIPSGQVVFDGSRTVAPGSVSQSNILASDAAAAQEALQVSQAQTNLQTSGMHTVAAPASTVTTQTPPPSLNTVEPTLDPRIAAIMAGTNTPDPAILELAKNNDLNVATLARQANATKTQDLGDDEVVVSLH